MSKITTSAMAVTGVASFVFIHTGLQMDVLIAGFFGGIVSEVFYYKSGVLRAILRAICSSLTAGYASAAVFWLFPGLIPATAEQAQNQRELVLFIAFCLGIVTYIVIPRFVEYVDKKANNCNI